MRLVVDTNIVFSTLLNPHSPIGEIMMNIQDDFVFFAPELLISELNRYSEKLKSYSKLNPEQLDLAKSLILKSIHFVSEDLISEESWKAALELTKDIDPDDTPFVALSIELAARLWTGDKLLSKGLTDKQPGVLITIPELQGYLKH